MHSSIMLKPTIFDWKSCLYPTDIYTQNGYNKTMIKSFADKETEKIFKQIFSKKLPQSIQRIALRKLVMIDNAGCLEDLRVPPANHLELLQGDRKRKIASTFSKPSDMR